MSKCVEVCSKEWMSRHKSSLLENNYIYNFMSLLGTSFIFETKWNRKWTKVIFSRRVTTEPLFERIWILNTVVIKESVLVHYRFSGCRKGPNVCLIINSTDSIEITNSIRYLIQSWIDKGWCLLFISTKINKTVKCKENKISSFRKITSKTRKPSPTVKNVSICLGYMHLEIIRSEKYLICSCVAWRFEPLFCIFFFFLLFENLK